MKVSILTRFSEKKPTYRCLALAMQNVLSLSGILTFSSIVNMQIIFSGNLITKIKIDLKNNKRSQ